MRIIIIAFLLPCFFITSSCSSDDNMDTTIDNTTYVNNWIYDQMEMYYLWNETLPANPDKSLNPDAFFASLLNGKDRFSWIQENYVDLLSSLSGVSSGDIGFEYIGYLVAEDSDLIIAQVAYVKPTTPAQLAGVKRGDLFTKVDGVQLTKSNWRSVLSGEGSTAEITFVDASLENPVKKTITKVSKYEENPVYLDTVYTVSDKKIGYLVYNFFALDNGSNDMRYSLLINQVFGRFQSAGVTDLVLDLRYNSGGSMLASITLSSMIVPNLNVTKTFSTVQFNSLYQAAYIRTYGSDALVDKFIDKIEVGKTQEQDINNLGNLKTLYVLTSNWTASASEMLINGLKPYMNVYLIGTTTVGKNVGSFSLYETDNARNKWGMQPIVLQYFNSNGTSDFENGFVPDLEARDNNLQKLDLGNSQEVLLQAAIQTITGAQKARMARIGGSLLQVAGSSFEKKAWSNKGIVDNRQPIPITDLK